jgi:hypothetical protein
MKKSFRVAAICVILFLFFSLAEMESLSTGASQIPIRPARLEIVDLPEEELDGEAMLFVQASKANIIVFAVVPGFTDKQNVEHFPAYKASLKNVKKLTVSIYFKVTKDAKVEIYPFISGPVAGLASGDEEPAQVNAKKNVIYRQVFETDLSVLPPGVIFPGLYDFLGFVTPSEDNFPFSKSGGMTHAACRVYMVK